MNGKIDTSPLIDKCLDRLANGDRTAWNELFQHAMPELLDLCVRMLDRHLSRPNPLITQNSLFAEAYLRLRKLLQRGTVIPRTAREFFGLAARNIRWQLLDMVRLPKSNQPEDDLTDLVIDDPNIVHEVIDREFWQQFWQTIESLDATDRGVFDQLWIQGRSQYDAADCLQITRNQVDASWRRIKSRVRSSCGDSIPCAL